MSQRTWFITGVSSGFGRPRTDQLLKRGDRVVELLLATSEGAASELNGCFEDASSRGQRSAGRKWPSELQNSRSSSGPPRLSAGFRSIL